MEHWTVRAELPDLVRPVPLDPSGRTGPTRGQAQRGGWRRTSRGYYVPALVDGSVPEQRVLEQSVRLGSAGAVTGWASLRWQGGHYFDGFARDGVTRQPVPVVSPDRQLSCSPACAPRGSTLDPEEVIVVRGMRCTTPERATFDEMRARDLREAVVTIDMAAQAELTSVRRMRAYVATRTNRRWTALVGEALDLADDDSWSPAETRLRLVWRLGARLPRPLCNRPVFALDGNLLGVPDLLDPVAGLVVEYDGADHLTARRRQRDVRREEGFRAHGLDYLTVLAPDLHDQVGLVRRLRGARARALATRELKPDGWTTTPPPWWTPPRPPLDERLDLRDLVAGQD